MNVLQGKTALITGASRGIGSYIARALSREGALVIGIASHFCAKVAMKFCVPLHHIHSLITSLTSRKSLLKITS